MSEAANLIPEGDLSLTTPAHAKMQELLGDMEEEVIGIRVYATPGGCSGISFGMTFADQVHDGDGVLECEGFKVVVDGGTMQYLRGVEIDFAEQGGSGQASFVFNNLQPVEQSGCGGCSSSASNGGGCS